MRENRRVLALLFLTCFCFGLARLTGQRDFGMASLWHLTLNFFAAFWQVDLLL